MSGDGGRLTYSLAVSRIRAFSRRGGLLLGGAVVLLLVVLSPSFGRAHPTGNYRPDLPPAALNTGCFPLPAGLVLPFAHQVRTDGDVDTPGGPRRRLVVQFDLVDADTARAALYEAFVAAGFARVPGPPEQATFSRPSTGPVGVTVTALDVAPDVVVQGYVVLDLPSIPVASQDPVCDDPYATKRFPPSYEHPS